MGRTRGGDLRHGGTPGRAAKGEAGSAGMRSGVPAAASASARVDDAAREFDLEGVVAGRSRVGQRRFGGAAEGGVVGLRAGERSASAARARQGFAATPPSAIRASTIAAAFDPQRRGGRDDREGVGGAVAHLEIARMRRRRRPPRPAVARRRSARPVRARCRAPARRRAGDGSLSSGISRRPALPSISTTASSATSGTQKSDGWVAMQCSLQPSTACSRVSPPRASQPAPGVALVAGAGDVVEIRRSACAAADCRRPSRRCAAAPRRPTAAPPRPRESAARSPASCARSALRTSAPIRTPPSGSASIRSSPARRLMSTRRLGRGDAALHQIEQVGAGGEIGGAGRRRRPRPPRRSSSGLT